MACRRSPQEFTREHLQQPRCRRPRPTRPLRCRAHRPDRRQRSGRRASPRPRALFGVSSKRCRPRSCGRAEAPGKWSIREVIQHLADSDLVGGFRLRMVLAHDPPVMPGYDQDLWATRLGYRDADVHEALEQFAALRAANLRHLGAPDAIGSGTSRDARRARRGKPRAHAAALRGARPAAPAPAGADSRGPAAGVCVSAVMIQALRRILALLGVDLVYRYRRARMKFASAPRLGSACLAAGSTNAETGPADERGRRRRT